MGAMTLNTAAYLTSTRSSIPGGIIKGATMDAALLLGMLALRFCPMAYLGFTQRHVGLISCITSTGMQRRRTPSKTEAHLNLFATVIQRAYPSSRRSGTS